MCSPKNVSFSLISRTALNILWRKIFLESAQQMRSEEQLFFRFTDSKFPQVSFSRAYTIFVLSKEHCQRNTHIFQWNIIFVRNKKTLNLCFGWQILRSYCFVAEVTFKETIVCGTCFSFPTTINLILINSKLNILPKINITSALRAVRSRRSWS